MKDKYEIAYSLHCVFPVLRFVNIFVSCKFTSMDIISLFSGLWNNASGVQKIYITPELYHSHSSKTLLSTLFLNNFSGAKKIYKSTT